MGALSTTKIIKDVLGQLTEEFALTTTVGAADAQKLPALNAQGVLDASIVNGKAVSAGVADAGKVLVLGGDGRIDTTMLPTGIGADTFVIQASEAIGAGKTVNVWNNAGAFRVRLADATTAGKSADGFVLSAVASGANATVYFEGANTAVTGQLPGVVFLSTTPGDATSVAPQASGNNRQQIGIAVSATTINFSRGEPLIKA